MFFILFNQALVLQSWEEGEWKRTHRFCYFSVLRENETKDFPSLGPFLAMSVNRSFIAIVFFPIEHPTGLLHPFTTPNNPHPLHKHLQIFITRNYFSIFPKPHKQKHALGFGHRGHGRQESDSACCVCVCGWSSGGQGAFGSLYSGKYWCVWWEVVLLVAEAELCWLGLGIEGKRGALLSSSRLC